jgi:hypothetical protein
MFQEEDAEYDGCGLFKDAIAETGCFVSEKLQNPPSRRQVFESKLKPKISCINTNVSQ